MTKRIQPGKAAIAASLSVDKRLDNMDFCLNCADRKECKSFCIHAAREIQKAMDKAARKAYEMAKLEFSRTLDGVTHDGEVEG